MILALFFAVVTAPAPGAFDASETPKQLCVRGASSNLRRSKDFVSYQVKDKVYNSYGIPRGSRSGYRIDHMIPLELGGTSNIKNLWPQPYVASKKKDADENYLHDQVCRHGMTLDKARHLMLEWWNK
ncbi:MAG: hypothetical protein NVS3B3_09350 [Aquirhabdus sp.]